MKRIEKTFKILKEKNEKAFIPYIMAGDGGLQALRERIVFLETAGATAIEIGIPFSDPVADGPVIQAAGIRALKANTTLKDVIEEIKKIRPIVHIPIIFMTYMNPIIAYGVERYMIDCAKAGVDGFIIPDLPVEEENIIAPAAEASGLELIRLVTLTSSEERIKMITSKGNGFVYAVTVNGITGARNEFQHNIAEHLQRVKSISPLPVLAGFGISKPEHVVQMNEYADGVIVGSKIIDLFQEGDLDGIAELIAARKGEKLAAK